MNKKKKLKKESYVGICQHCKLKIGRRQKFKIIGTVLKDRFGRQKRLLVHKVCAVQELQLHVNYAYQELELLRSSNGNLINEGIKINKTNKKGGKNSTKSQKQLSKLRLKKHKSKPKK